MQQQGDSGVDRVRLQFGQFGVGGEYGSGFSSAAAMPQQYSESQGPSFQQQATNFASTSYGSQPSSHTGACRAPWSSAGVVSFPIPIQSFILELYLG